MRSSEVKFASLPAPRGQGASLTRLARFPDPTGQGGTRDKEDKEKVGFPDPSGQGGQSVLLVLHPNPP